MDDGPIDIRSYPIPDWSARKLSAVQNGKWTYFYNSGNNETIFDYEPYSKKTLSILSQRDKQSTKSRSISLNTSANLKDDPREEQFVNYDSYQLFEQSKQREKMQQQIFLTPTLTKPEQKASKFQNSEKLNETFVPSETNVVDEIRPIIPLTPGLSVAKTHKENSEPVIIENEASECEKTFYFNPPNNDPKMRSAFLFFRSSQKKASRTDKSKKTINDILSSKAPRQAISQLRRPKGSEQRPFTFKTINNNNLSSTYNFGNSSDKK